MDHTLQLRQGMLKDPLYDVQQRLLEQQACVLSNSREFPVRVVDGRIGLAEGTVGAWLVCGFLRLEHSACPSFYLVADVSPLAKGARHVVVIDGRPSTAAGDNEGTFEGRVDEGRLTFVHTADPTCYIELAVFHVVQKYKAWQARYGALSAAGGKVKSIRACRKIFP